MLPALPPLARPGAPVVALVKPQFEVGRADVGKGGIVRDEAARARALAEVRAAAAALGYDVGADTTSPITGGKGNIEFLLALRAPAARYGSLIWPVPAQCETIAETLSAESGEYE